MAPKLKFCPYLVMWWPRIFTLDFNFLEKLNTAQLRLLNSQKFLSGIFACSCGSKPVFLSKFSHAVTLTFDFWTLNFQKCLTLPQSVFWIDKILSDIFEWSGISGRMPHHHPHIHLRWSFGSKPVFLSAFGHVVTLTFDLWTSKFQKCLKLCH